MRPLVPPVRRSGPLWLGVPLPLWRGDIGIDVEERALPGGSLKSWDSLCSPDIESAMNQPNVKPRVVTADPKTYSHRGNHRHVPAPLALDDSPRMSRAPGAGLHQMLARPLVP